MCRLLCWILVLGVVTVRGEIRVVEPEAIRETQGSNPQGLVEHQGKLYVTAGSATVRERPLWQLGEGVVGGAQRLTEESVSSFKVSCGDSLYFWSENDLWSLRDKEVVRISDWYGDEDWSPHPASRLVGCDESSGTFLFVTVDRTKNNAAVLWRSEGSVETTRKLFDFPSEVRGDQAQFFASESRMLVKAEFSLESERRMHLYASVSMMVWNRRHTKLPDCRRRSTV